MTVPINAISFQTAYRSLDASERAFVDSFIAESERDARRVNINLREYLATFDFDSLPYAHSRIIERQIVRAAIVERVNEIIAMSEISVERWIKEVAKIAFSTLGDFIKEDVIDISEITPDQMSVISGYERNVTMYGPNVKIKLHDKMKALEMYGKFVGAVESEKTKQNGSLDLNLPVGVSEQNAADIYARMIEHE